MKIAKTIGAGIIGLLLVAFIVALMQPNEYNVQESITVEVSRVGLIAHVVDLKKWRPWSPWIERDPTMKLKYSDVTAGPGAHVTWESETEGFGKQTITDVVESEFIKTKLEFYKPFTGVAYSYFKFKEASPTSTEVIWRIEAENKGIVEKFFYFVMKVPSMIGKDFKKGLENLKKVAEEGDGTEA